MVALSLDEEDEFLDVVHNLSRLSHENISKLIGYSLEQGEHILVYDYSKNGSLDDVLFSSNEQHEALSWKARVMIALGVARALEYVFSQHDLNFSKCIILHFFIWHVPRKRNPLCTHSTFHF